MAKGEFIEVIKGQRWRKIESTRASCKTLESKKKLSFRASEARPGIQYFRAIPAFARNDGVKDFWRRLTLFEKGKKDRIHV
jgi:hypothetical protein